MGETSAKNVGYVKTCKKEMFKVISKAPTKFFDRKKETGH